MYINHALKILMIQNSHGNMFQQQCNISQRTTLYEYWRSFKDCVTIFFPYYNGIL